MVVDKRLSLSIGIVKCILQKEHVKFKNHNLTTTVFADPLRNEWR